MFGHVDEKCPYKRYGDSKDARTIAELVRKAKEVEVWQDVVPQRGTRKGVVGSEEAGSNGNNAIKFGMERVRSCP